MKSIITLFLLVFFAASASAEVVRSRIYGIDLGGKSGEDHFVMFENGRVAFFPHSDDVVLATLLEVQRKKDLLEAEVSSDNELLNLKKIETKEFGNSHLHLPLDRSRSTFSPTVVNGPDSAQAIFQRMRTDAGYFSECYNRAHVWAVEEFQKTQLKSLKLFLFFTRKYIRNYRYKWWFHVSPMIMVNDGQKTTQKVIDRRFAKSPMDVKAWTDMFIYSRRSCPIAQKYSDYSNNQYSEDCYLMPVSMYYWQPRDMERFERDGFEKQSFISSEVNWAYREAF
jgi:hypothetical protein